MLKKMLNQARIKVEIEPLDPLLVKSGQATVGGTDMCFVRTYKNKDPEPFLPGSSLKGVVRAYCEKICRSLRPDPVPVCLPYIDPKDNKASKEEKKQASCGLQFSRWEKNNRDQLHSWQVYEMSCPACRLFGSLHFTGRLSVSDAYTLEKPVVEERDGVAIDRITGGAASGAKYDLEVLTKGRFEADIEIRNFERWQLGLLGLALRDMQEGLIRLGSGKSRGLGRFKGTITSFKLSFFNQNPAQLTGLRGLCTEQEIKDYALALENKAENQPALPSPARNGLRYDYDLTQNWMEQVETGVEDLCAYISTTPWPHNLQDFVQGGR